MASSVDLACCLGVLPSEGPEDGIKDGCSIVGVCSLHGSNLGIDVGAEDCIVDGC